jgi:holo-[acyl-carrier protein] synthase
MIGIDLVKTSRMKRMIERFGDKALLKFLSNDEILLVKNHKTAAGFWAVKEAVSKALGTGIGSECAFHDIEIAKTQKGAPTIKLSSDIVNLYNITDTSVSITHDGEYAIAVVAIESSTTHKIK